MEMRKIS